jgi:hypothetical protein
MTWAVPPDGDMCCGVDGLYAADRRVLSLWRVTVNDRIFHVNAQQYLPDGVRGSAQVPPIDDCGLDPQVSVTRLGLVRYWGAAEQIEAVNRGNRPFTATLRLFASSDFATLRNAVAEQPGQAREWRIEHDRAVACAGDGPVVTVRLPDGADVGESSAAVLQMRWDLTIPPHGSWKTMFYILAAFAFDDTSGI